jgi:hypothetical protein
MCESLIQRFFSRDKINERLNINILMNNKNKRHLSVAIRENSKRKLFDVFSLSSMNHIIELLASIFKFQNFI